MEHANGQSVSKKPRRFEKRIVKAVAPVNIATIKYWGKADEKNILPLNPSISVTLDTSQMCTETTITASRRQNECDDIHDTIILNGCSSKITPRMANVLSKMRKAAFQHGSKLWDWPLQIESTNNFPTAAGLASSASGLACFVFCLKNLYDLDGDFSHIARLGSGSACRSMLGGFVEWTLIDDPDKSCAKSIADAAHWPELRILICIGNESKKACGSTDGMQSSVRSSELLKARVKNVLPSRLDAMRAAILQRDFETFAQVTMQESNQLHAVCLDTFPPLVYLDSSSFLVMRLVHALNEAAERTLAAYTCDAGPHVFLFVLESDVPRVLESLRSTFPVGHGSELREVPVIGWDSGHTNSSPGAAPLPKIEPLENGLTRIICTEVGIGPTVTFISDT